MFKKGAMWFPGKTTLCPQMFSHSTRCLTPNVLSTNSIISVDKYWNTENIFIRQRLLCEHFSQVLICCVSTGLLCKYSSGVLVCCASTLAECCSIV